MYKVLIAEDEAIVRLGFKNMLDWESLDMVVTSLAADGEEAWKLFCENKPDIVITDIRMPGLDGMELIRRIRQTGANTQIIILTCVDDFEMVQKALEMGATGYILKLTAGIEEIMRLLKKAKSILDKEGLLRDAHKWIDIDMIKQEVWNNYIIDRKIDAWQFAEFAEKAGIRMEKNGMRIILFSIPHSGKADESDSANVAGKQKYVRDIIDNLLAKYSVGECFQQKDNRYSILLSASMAEEKESFEIMEEVKHVLYQNLGADINCSRSKEGQGVSSLPELYRQALESLEKEKNEGLPKRILLAVRYMHENYSGDISLQSVAEMLGISANYLSHMFTKCLNISFVNYLNKIRVEESKKLLDNPSLKVYEVSERVGFYSTAYFIRVFKSVTGQTPNEYRSGDQL